MKKILVTCISLFSSLTGFAQNTIERNDFLQEVTMQLLDTKDKYTPGQHKSATRIPDVAYDKQYLYITPYYDVSEAQILIYDKADNIIHSVYTPLTGSGTVIILPENVIEDMYYLELVYNGLSYIGSFHSL